MLLLLHQGLTDMDGCLTGRAGVTLMSAPNNTLYPFVYVDRDFNVPNTGACAFDNVWSMYICKGVKWGTVR
jgi:hypothetical protein